MCKTTDDRNRWFFKERCRLKIRAFCVRLSIPKTQAPQHQLLPESITLLYLPRMNGSPLEINDSKIRSDSPAFVTLHRVRSAEKKTLIDYCDGGRRVGEMVYCSRERVEASEGVQFEVYLREEKVLKGIFSREIREDEWKLECKCALESELVGLAISEAVVCLMCEEHEQINEKVEMVMRRRRRRSTCTATTKWLEEIPEEREVDYVDESSSSPSDDCIYKDDDTDHISHSDHGEEEESEIEMEMEGVRWAVDVGIWVMCLGVGYLVSKVATSSKNLRRMKIL